MNEFIFFELSPELRLIEGEEAKHWEVLVKSSSKKSSDGKATRCPICNGRLQNAEGKYIFCWDCDFKMIVELSKE